MDRLPAVRQLLVILCLLMNVSLMLMPFDSTHAHVDSDHTHGAGVHGGHSHDFDYGLEDDAGEASIVVDLQPALSSQTPFQSEFLAYWLPLACTFALSLLLVRLCLGSFAFPRSDPKPHSHHQYWRPPLRGPPSFSIQTA